MRGGYERKGRTHGGITSAFCSFTPGTISTLILHAQVFSILV